MQATQKSLLHAGDKKPFAMPCGPAAAKHSKRRASNKIQPVSHEIGTLLSRFSLTAKGERRAAKSLSKL